MIYLSVKVQEGKSNYILTLLMMSHTSYISQVLQVSNQITALVISFLGFVFSFSVSGEDWAIAD